MQNGEIKQIENWIFDWSGTLVDDLAMVLDATNHVLSVYDRPRMELAEFKRRFRLPYQGFYEEILPGVPLDELEDHFRVGFAASADRGTKSPLLPHANEFLDFLSQQGKRMFILSSMDAPSFETHARELEVRQYFEATYAGVLDKRELMPRILETHDLVADSTVFVGDMEHDIVTAHHGGVFSIALLTGYQSEDELLARSPSLLCKDLSELKSLLV